MSISKKTRFEVFKRDGFKCIYCGSSPPVVILEADHIEPISKGGSNEIENLVTSCFGCNRGKSNIPLSKIPPKLDLNIKEGTEKEEQIVEYRKFVAKIRRRKNRDIKKVEKIYSATHENYEFSDNFREVSMKRFISLLPLDQIEDAMRIACEKFSYNENKSLKYFCGICWRKVDERANA